MLLPAKHLKEEVMREEMESTAALPNQDATNGLLLQLLLICKGSCRELTTEFLTTVMPPSHPSVEIDIKY